MALEQYSLCLVDLLTSFADNLFSLDHCSNQPLFSTTMSNTLIALVPILDGTNYCSWKCSMEAYLKSQDLWNVTTSVETSPETPTRELNDGTVVDVSLIPDYIIAAQVKFTTNAQKAAGNIMLHAIPRIQEVIQSMSITDMWTHLETECHGSKGPWLKVSVDVTCSAQVLSVSTRRGEDSQDERDKQSWIGDKVETEVSTLCNYSFKYDCSSRLRASSIIQQLACYDIV
jgi:Domain of unknown function (DUF4219)